LILAVLVACLSASDPDLLLDGTRVASLPRPRVFSTRDEIARIRERARDPLFRDAAEALARAAREGLEVPLPRFETAWWEEAKKKPFAETYAEIYHHTYTVPAPAMTAAWRLARAGIALDEPSWRARAREILLHYTEYSFGFDHYDVGLNYALWGILALEVHDLFFDEFGAEDRRALDGFFSRLLRAELANDEFWLREGIGGIVNNHLAWHKRMIGAIGIAYGIDELARASFDGPRGLRELIELGTLDDGIWCESSLPYHFTALHGLAEHAWILRRAGFAPDPAGAAFADGRRLRDLFTGIAGTVFPDRTIPAVGDCYASRSRLADMGVWGAAYDAWKDPLHAWLLGEAKRREPWETLRFGMPAPAAPPPMESRVWTEHGLLALRSRAGTSYWDGDGWTLFAVFGRTGVHSHEDKLSAILYGWGRLAAADREAHTDAEHSFSAPVQQELNRQTICHNALLVDGKGHGFVPRRLDLIEFRSDPEVKAAAIGDLGGIVYPGVRQLRSFRVCDAFVLDSLEAASDSPHEYTWVFHPEGEGRGADLAWRDAALPPDPPWRWLGGAAEARAAGPVAFRWPCGDRTLAVDLAFPGEARILTAIFPADDARRGGKPMLLVTVRAERARFAALVRLGAPGRAPVSPARILEETAPDGRIRVTIESDGARRTFLIGRLP